jgi:hypothetical protein
LTRRGPAADKNKSRTFSGEAGAVPTNPDRAVPPPSPRTALTLGQMRAQGWELVARCAKCRVTLEVSLDALIRLHGADALWWGRRPTCRVVDCGGRVCFMARSFRLGSWRSLGDRLSRDEIARYRGLSNRS